MEARGKGDEKKWMKICYVHEQTPLKECNQYVLQKCTNKVFLKYVTGYGKLF